MATNIIPPMPNVADVPTRLPLSVLQGVTVESIEQQLEDASGKIEITNRGITRELTSLRKISVGYNLAVTLSHFHAFLGSRCVGGKGAIKFSSGELFMPDFSVFPANRMYNQHTSVHVYAPGPAPVMILEVVWDTEVNTEGKKLKKVWNDLFEAVGENNTQIEEAWVLAITHHIPNDISEAVPSLYHWVPIIGSLITCLLHWLVQYCFSHPRRISLRHLSGWYRTVLDWSVSLGRWIVQNAFNITPELDHAPIQGPYLAVCFRASEETKYFPLCPDAFLLLPPQCFHYAAEPLSTNTLLRGK